MLESFLKYGTVALRYAAYLKYLPIAAQFITFIRTAERDFKNQPGAARAEWAAEKFRDFVGLFASARTIGPKLAKALNDGAEALITVVVQFFNEVNGSVPALPPADEPTE
jgi:hypothetical protein